VTDRARRGVLDTNTVILIGRVHDSSALPQEPVVTTITVAELSVGPLVTRDEAERITRLGHLQLAESFFDPLPFDRAAAHAFGRVSASLRRHGRTAAARTYDAMIAATALANDLGVHTCNPSDFAGIDGLTVVAVPHPDRSDRDGAGRSRGSTSEEDQR
jgi:predicted nucleic acid-binding protein